MTELRVELSSTINKDEDGDWVLYSCALNDALQAGMTRDEAITRISKCLEACAGIETEKLRPGMLQDGLTTVVALLDDYASGEAAGGGMDWEELDFTFRITCENFPGWYEERQAEMAAKRWPLEDWQYEVNCGDTKLGYLEWLAHKLEDSRN